MGWSNGIGDAADGTGSLAALRRSAAPPARDDTAARSRKPIRDVLHAAALAAVLVPVTAQAQSATDRIDLTGLIYSESGRTSVVEPVVRFSHILPDGQSISATLGIDVITGASPTGALPAGTITGTRPGGRDSIQARTMASGRTPSSGSGSQSTAGQIPLANFNDQRFSLDAEWKKPFARFFTTTVGGHFSRERDYQSKGINGTASVDVFRKLVTLTAGGGINQDSVFPHGGTPIGLTTGTIVSNSANAKRVTTAMLGVSGILTRRWMVGVTGTKTSESGYLTEPYKWVTVQDPATGAPVMDLTDKRPDTRDRNSLLFSSVYHFTNDVLYSSYRYYWDSWDLKSHTLDFKYRHDLYGDASDPNEGFAYIEPLIRFYRQSAARFYTAGLVQGQPLPDFATSDYRVGDLNTFTMGATFGYKPDYSTNEWTLRVQFMRQAGGSSPPPNAVGVQRTYDLVPPLNIFALTVGYSFDY